MKTPNLKLANLLFYAAAWASIAALGACGSPQKETGQTVGGSLVLTNPINLERTDEPVLLTRTQLAGFFGPFDVGLIPVILQADGALAAYQVDDLDGDGIWDEVALSQHFAPNESITLQITFADPAEARTPTLPVRTNIRFAEGNLTPEGKISKDYDEKTYGTRVADSLTANATLYFQMEGPGWESDKIGYRIYFDKRHAKDIFGKLRPEPALDVAGIDSDYHTMRDWGMDLLKVGTSLGAGSIGLEVNGKFHPIGPANKGEYRLLTEGPVRSSFEIVLTDCPIDGQLYQVKEKITIWAGQHWFEDEVTISGGEGEKILLTGIVDKFDLPLLQGENKHGVHAFGTFGLQSENKDDLAMAVMVPGNILLGTASAPKKGDLITETHLMRIRANDRIPIQYYFMAVWPFADTHLNTPEAFMAYADQIAHRLSRPVLVELGSAL
jgi:hypothetical protein